MFLRRVSAIPIRQIQRSFSATSHRSTLNKFSSSHSAKSESSYQYGSRDNTWDMHLMDPRLWILLAGQAVILGLNNNPVLAEDVHTESNSKNEVEGTSLTGLQRIEDGSVVSNIHTSKWRVFTDNGRDSFLQGKLELAEKFFFSAIQEAKEGFGERDPHVASAYNNLAELYRVKKAFDKAEPLYLEAISILEKSFGPEDVRVGAALHNLGQFYLVQRKLKEACEHYERALKIKRRVLGHGHPDYADTMYHLGTVLYLQGKERDAEALILDSVKILEEDGEEDSIACIRRLRYLSQIYLRSNRLSDTENIQRKILHKMELSKGWRSLETVNAAEALALTLESNGELSKARELYECCLDARKSILPEDHIQIAANMLHIAKVLMLSSRQLRKMDLHKAISELDEAKVLLSDSVRIAKGVLNKVKKQKDNTEYRDARSNDLAAFVILLQSFDALGLLEMTRNEIQEPKDELSQEAEDALFQCISAYKEFGAKRSMGVSLEVKSEFLSCLKHLSALLADKSGNTSSL